MTGIFLRETVGNKNNLLETTENPRRNVFGLERTIDRAIIMIMLTYEIEVKRDKKETEKLFRSDDKKYHVLSGNHS